MTDNPIQSLTPNQQAMARDLMQDIEVAVMDRFLTRLEVAEVLEVLARLMQVQNEIADCEDVTRRFVGGGRANAGQKTG